MADETDVAIGVFITAVAIGGGYGLYRLLRREVTPPKRPPPPVDLTFATKVVEALVPKLGLTPAEPGDLGKIERHRVFFVYRRAVALGLADATLRDGPGLETLKQRVEQDLTRVGGFVAGQVGTASARGPYFGGAGGPDPRHLDLGRFVAPRIGGPPPTTEAEAVAATAPTGSQAQTLRELDARRLRAIGIIWRAAAIDTDLWAGANLKVDDLTEILDRRLRSVERLRFEASAGATPNGAGSSFVERRFRSGNNPSTIAGPWSDDFTVRMFEAPSVPRGATSISGDWVLEEFFATSSNVIIDAGFPRYTGGINNSGIAFLNWYRNFATDEFDWNIWPGTRMGRDAAQAVHVWELTPNDGAGREGYGWVLKPVQGGIQAAEIIRRLFVSSTDWWERAWLHADGVMSALHLEALRHAKLRRTQNDDLFDALPTRFSLALDDYFEVRAHTVRPANGIMRAGRTDHFENGAVAPDDLQIGDQVLYELNPVLLALGAKGWEYPTALVTDVDTAPNKPELQPDRLRVQGFGTADLDHPSLQLLLAKQLDATLKAVQDYIPREIARRVAAGFSSPTRLEWDSGLIVTPDDSRHNDSNALRMWNPYGDTWDPPGPWWIWINLNAPMWRGAFGGDVVKILGSMPRGILWIADDKLLPEFHGRAEANATLPVGPGFQQPPWEDDVFENPTGDPRRTIFVPLYEPDGGWLAYFSDKAATPNLHFNSRLVPIVVDAPWLPDLARRDGNIRVIRPRIEPTP
jgi:hypothetical protein